MTIPLKYLEHPLTKNTALDMMADANSSLIIQITGKLYKRYIWKSLRFREDIVIAEDDSLLPHIMDSISSIVVIDEVVYNITCSEKSLLRNKITIDTLYVVESNLAVMNYCFSMGNYKATLFRFGFGTRRLLEIKKELNTNEAKIKINNLYKDYCKFTKRLSPHVPLKSKLQLLLFRTNIDLYDFVRTHSK